MGENHGKTEPDGRPGSFRNQGSQPARGRPASLLGRNERSRDYAGHMPGPNPGANAGLAVDLPGGYVQGGRESRPTAYGADGSGLKSAAHPASPDFSSGASELAGKLYAQRV